MTTVIAQDVPRRGRSMALWAGVIGAPLAWAVQLPVIYALSPWACVSDTYVVLHVLSAVFFALALVGGVLAWRDYRAAGEGAPDETAGGPVARTRFLGALGVALAAYSAIVILAQSIAAFFFTGCPA